MGVEKFILLGHSFGAFLACSYAIRHPSRVRHLILVEPWGIFPALSEEEIKRKFPFLANRVWQMAIRMKPFDLVRMAGPYGEVGLGYEVTIGLTYVISRKRCDSAKQTRSVQKLRRAIHELRLPLQCAETNVSGLCLPLRW